MKEIDKVLDQNEKVFWEGSPSFWPFFFGRTLGLTIFAAFWMAFLMGILLVTWNAPGPFRYMVFVTPHFWIGLVMLFGPSIYTALVFKHTHYAITDKRVIIQKGLIGRDFEIIDFDQISHAEVNVGVFDKLFGGNSGSIVFATAGSLSSDNQRNQIIKPSTISNVASPYDVFKFFKKTAHDVKTDINFPNKMRPSENPGYQTNYDPNKK